jgi:hypothetical protein
MFGSLGSLEPMLERLKIGTVTDKLPNLPRRSGSLPSILQGLYITWKGTRLVFEILPSSLLVM